MSYQASLQLYPEWNSVGRLQFHRSVLTQLDWIDPKISARAVIELNNVLHAYESNETSTCCLCLCFGSSSSAETETLAALQKVLNKFNAYLSSGRSLQVSEAVPSVAGCKAHWSLWTLGSTDAERLRSVWIEVALVPIDVDESTLRRFVSEHQTLQSPSQYSALSATATPQRDALLSPERPSGGSAGKSGTLSLSPDSPKMHCDSFDPVKPSISESLISTTWHAGSVEPVLMRGDAGLEVPSNGGDFTLLPDDQANAEPIQRNLFPESVPSNRLTSPPVNLPKRQRPTPSRVMSLADSPRQAHSYRYDLASTPNAIPFPVSLTSPAPLIRPGK